jgi:predicted nucleic acid-binding protein
MKLYLLDSTPVSAYLHGRKAVIDLVTPWIIRREVATSILVYAEVTEYIKGLSDFPRRHKDFRRLLGEIYPYFLTYSILERYADLRRLLRSPYGTGLIGDIDTLIAATALERNLTVVTADRDFERVPGLQVKLISIK